MKYPSSNRVVYTCYDQAGRAQWVRKDSATGSDVYAESDWLSLGRWACGVSVQRRVPLANASDPLGDAIRAQFPNRTAAANESARPDEAAREELLSALAAEHDDKEDAP